MNVLSVAIARDDTSVDALGQADEHPGSGAALGVTGQVLLRDDGNSIARRARQVLEDIVVDARLVLVVCLGAGTVDRDHT